MTGKTILADRPDILVFPPLAAAVSIGAAIVLDAIRPFADPPGWIAPVWVVIVGALLVLIACLVAVTGVKAFKTAGTPVDPRRGAMVVVETGPYRFTRNPMYLGMVLLLVGLGLALSLEWGIVLAPLLWVVLHFGVVLREEAYLEAKFGAPYQHYKARTRRWL